MALHHAAIRVGDVAGDPAYPDAGIVDVLVELVGAAPPA